MSNYSFDPHPERKKRRSGWLIGCGAGILVTSCMVFILLGGFAGLLALFGGEPEGLNVAVVMPTSQVQVGNPFEITIILENTGTKNINVTQIELPNDLLKNTLVTGVDPVGIKGLDYGDQTAYDFDLLIAPMGKESVVFSFNPLQSGDINGEIDVQVGTKTASRAIRVVIAPTSVAGETSEEDETPILGEVIPYRSVVQIIAMVEMDGELMEGWWGSGTIVSEDGLILTNAHVILSDRFYEVVDLIVAITTEQDRPPVPMFYADVLQADANLDLAVIKVRSDLNGGPANFESLGIEPVPLGRSDSLELGDEIIIIGYPAIGGETITLTRGEVSGFTAQDPYGIRAFIKTSASFSGGNSGGLAATLQGEIIGVPTKLGSGDAEVDYVDCRALADTNRDGVIDENDSCIPTGGFINALRPMRLAEPLIEAAKAGQVAIVENIDVEYQEDFEPEGNIILSDDFSSNLNEWGLYNETDGLIEITDGQLEISAYAERLIFWTVLPDIYDQLVMTVDAQVLNSVGDGDFGFVCGLTDGGNFTALEISEDGYYTIWKYEDNSYVPLVEWTYSDIIAAGGPFVLAAYCGPDQLALAVNDTLLGETYDPNYVPGYVGLVTGCWDQPNVRIAFDNYYIMEP